VVNPTPGTSGEVPPTCPHCGAAISPESRVCPSCGALQPVKKTGFTAGSTVDLGDARIVLDAQLGEGGMGIVWRGWLFHAPGTPRASDPPLPIAFKALAPRARAVPELRALFLREAEAMRALSHPNVVRFHALADRAGELGIAMELVDGDNLEAVIARHVARARLAGPHGLPGLPFRRAWHYMEQLLGGLGGAHALGLVHRDVKPSNVLIRRDGMVKLSDFGIAQLSSQPDPAMADPNVLPPGTGPYMSPEQVLARPLDGRSDLYSAGIVLYEMIAGRTPFDTEGRGELVMRQDHVLTPPPPVRRFVPQAPPILDALFLRALAKDPSARFGSAIEMGDAFRSALGIPESPEWRAQAELAHVARVSTPPDARSSSPTGVSTPVGRAERMATLRLFLNERYRTAKMER
jgi:serine/threonine protein kinase